MRDDTLIIFAKFKKELLESDEIQTLLEQFRQKGIEEGRNEVSNRPISQQCPLAYFEKCPSGNFSSSVCVRCRSLKELVLCIPMSEEFIERIATKSIEKSNDNLYDHLKDMDGDFKKTMKTFLNEIISNTEKEKKDSSLTNEDRLVIMSAATVLKQIDDDSRPIKDATLSYLKEFNKWLQEIIEPNKLIKPKIVEETIS